VQADDVLPQFIADALAEINQKLEILMTDASAEQAQINSLADAINVVGGHVTAAATQIQAYIDAHPEVPAADLTPLSSAVASLQNADTGLTAVLPATPDAPPPADPIPAPPADPTVPVDVGAPPDTSGSTPDVPPDAPLPS